MQLKDEHVYAVAQPEYPEVGPHKLSKDKWNCRHSFVSGLGPDARPADRDISDVVQEWYDSASPNVTHIAENIEVHCHNMVKHHLHEVILFSLKNNLIYQATHVIAHGACEVVAVKWCLFYIRKVFKGMPHWSTPSHSNRECIGIFQYDVTKGWWANVIKALVHILDSLLWPPFPLFFIIFFLANRAEPVKEQVLKDVLKGAEDESSDYGKPKVGKLGPSVTLGQSLLKVPNWLEGRHGEGQKIEYYNYNADVEE